MVLKANKKRQEILVPLRLVELIPENDFCFLVENVLEQIDFEKYNSKFSVTASSSKSVFLKLPKRYNLDELLCVRFERSIDNAGVFSLNNSKFQVLDKSLPPKTKVQIYLSQKLEW